MRMIENQFALVRISDCKTVALGLSWLLFGLLGGAFVFA